MHAPIAEIPPPTPRRPPRKPPRSLSVMVGLGLSLGLLDAFVILTFPARLIPEISETWEDILRLGIMFVLYLLPLLLVWRGFNWARWLMVGLSALTILLAFTPPAPEVSLPLIQSIVNWLYVAYCLALIVFLLTPAMRRHFSAPAVENL